MALVYYQVSYFPMGAQGLKVVAQMVGRCNLKAVETRVGSPI